MMSLSFLTSIFLSLLPCFRCDIEESWEGLPDSHTFFNDFAAAGKPVIFRGAMLDSKIREAFDFDAFVNKYGSEPAIAATIPYAGMPITVTIFCYVEINQSLLIPIYRKRFCSAML
jgi:hypothetical protein